MEEVLNSCCSEQNLHELMGVLNGDVSFNPALVQVAQQISHYYESKMDFKDILALASAKDAERNYGQSDERLMKKHKEDLKVIETASGGTLILFIERLVTEKAESDWLADVAGSLSGTKPSKAMIEGMAIQTCRRQDQCDAVRARLESLIAEKTSQASTVILNDSQVTALLDACLKSGLATSRQDDRKIKGLVDEVHEKAVTCKDAKYMEEFLNSRCSKQNLNDLKGVLNGHGSLNPALCEVARLISRHRQTRVRHSECPDENLLNKCNEDLEAIWTASTATLIVLIERLVTEQVNSKWMLAISGSLSDQTPSKKMIEDMNIQNGRREVKRCALCARLQSLIMRSTSEASLSSSEASRSNSEASVVLCKNSL